MVSADDVAQLAVDKLGYVMDPHELVTLRRACGVVREDAEVEEEIDDAFDAQEAPSVIETSRLVQLLDTMSGNP